MITNTKSFPDCKSRKKYIDLYLSIGYQFKSGKRVPNGTKHKLILISGMTIVEMYHL